MSEISTEDYMYIESIGMILYYWDLPQGRRPSYSSLYTEALKIAKSKTTITYPILRELVAQDAIAFKAENGIAIQPDNGLVPILETLQLYAGDMPIDIIINTDLARITISRSTISNILSRLK